MNTRGKRAVIYTRVSLDNTGEGKSNARQREDCEKLADLRGWDVIEVVDDISRSAYGKKARPGWQRVLAMIEAGAVDVVVAWHMDRMTRNMADLEHLITLSEERNVGVATVSGDIDLTNDVGRMVARILAAVARAEVERKSARQRRANYQRRAEGVPWESGWRAFGYEKDGTLIPTEADLIREAAETVLNGGSLRSVVRHWKELGVSTPRSSKGVDGWTHNGVRSILLNPRNAGLATYKGEVIGKGNWEAIFPETTHTLLQVKLKDPARLTRPASRGRTASNLLTGIAICDTCGETVSGGTGHKGALIYQCKNYHVSTAREEADSAVRAAFASTVALVRPGLLIPVRPSQTPSALWEESERLSSRLGDLSASFARGGITIDQLEAGTRDLRAQLDDVERQIAASEGTVEDPRALRAENVRQFLDLDLESQRAILSRLAVIRLYPKGRGRKNVPIDQQVTVFLRATRSASSVRHMPGDLGQKPEESPSEYLIPALNERPTS